MKKILFTLLLVVLGITVKAQDLDCVFTVNGIRYKITSVDNHEVSVIKKDDNGCASYGGRIIIPDSVEYNSVYYRVTSLEDETFYFSTLNSISLPSGIYSIGERCFYSSYINCDIHLPDSLRIIGEYAFFSVSGIQNIYMPSLVDSLGMRVFARMPELKNIIVDSTNMTYTSLEGVLYDKEKETIICSPANRVGTYIIPSGVSTIGQLAFEGCKFSKIVLPNTIANIEDGAFWLCSNLVELNIPSSVIYIDGGVFAGVNRLCSISIDSLNTSYKLVDGCIYSMNMDTLVAYNFASGDVVIPQGVRIISDNSFAITDGLNTLVFPEGVEIIKSGAFQYSAVNNISLPSTLKKIEAYAFAYSALKDVVIPNSVTEIGVGVFTCSRLETVVMSDSVKVIPTSAFEACSNLNSYTGGAAVEKIRIYAFSSCGTFAQNLVFLPNLKVLESGAFFLTEIKQVEFTGIIDTIGGSNFGDLRTLKLVNPTPPYTPKVANQVFRVVIPCGATEAYLADPKWSSYTYVEDCDGIDESEESNVRVVAKTRVIEVLNAEGCSVAIYDAMGRCLVSEGATGSSSRTYTVPTTGLYVVSIDGKGYKVVVK